MLGPMVKRTINSDRKPRRRAFGSKVEVSRGMDQSQGELFFKIEFKKRIGCTGEKNGVLGTGVDFIESSMVEIQQGCMLR